VSKIDSVIADVEAVIERLGDVHSRLKELKEEAEAVEKARERLRGQRAKKGEKRH
jgi:C4-type Zn-finger protein